VSAARKHRKRRFRLGGAYWDTVAPRWRERVFNTLKQDRRGVIAAEIARMARGASDVADFGCGVGVFFPLLMRLFPRVHGFDISPACVKKALRKARGRAGVTASVAASAPGAQHGRYGAVLCVNTALHPKRRIWLGVLRSARDLLKPRGRLVLVVPSLESAGLIARANRTPLKSRRGVVWSGAVPTKHYSREELAALLTGLGFRSVRIRRVEYSWRSHEIAPPRELRKTGPWDWLAAARLG
jgi:SAM-dependent methyltransferase